MMHGAESWSYKFPARPPRLLKTIPTISGVGSKGIVMALYALLRSNPSASAEDIEAGLDGNLCRCTGEGPREEPWIDSSNTRKNNRPPPP